MARDQAPDSVEPTAAALSRRTLLRAGAWSAPIIALAAAVPAASASVNVGALGFANESMWFDWDDSGHRDGIAGCTTVFLSSADAASVGPVSFVVTVPSAGMSTTVLPSIEETDNNWTASTGEVVGGNLISYTFTYPNLTVPTAAYSTRITFHLPTESGTNLAPPLDWAWNAIAENATSAGALGSLLGLFVTANHDLLIVDAGTLTPDGDELLWSGASIAYAEPGPVSVDYTAVLRGPQGTIIALLASGSLANVTTTPSLLAPVTYSSVRAGGPLLPGDYEVTLAVLGAGGVAEDTTTTAF